MGRTSFSGSIPSALGNLSNLRFLSLSGLVRLSGTVPTELRRLTSLGESSQNLCTLHGSVSTGISILTIVVVVIERLELPTESKLSGTVPSELCDLLTKGKLEDFVGPVDICSCCNNVYYGG